MRFSFSLAIGALAVLGHAYLYFRFAQAVRSRAARIAFAAWLVAMTALLLSRRALMDAGEGFPRAVLVTALGWMGVALMLLLSLLAADVVALIARRLPRRAESPSLPRRTVLTGAAATVGATVAGYGVARTFADAEITEHAVKLAKLPKTLDGLRIVQLTDLHVGPVIRRAFVQRLVDRVNALEPDLVVITGDLVDGDVDTLGPSVAALGGLKARFGRFFVTGNHDYSSGEAEWTAFLDTVGIPSLRNRRIEIGDAGGTFDLVGVDDWTSGRRHGRKAYDLDLALKDRDPDRASVLLAHQPANFDVAAARGVDLQISGHTHGGQLFPMTLLIGAVWPHVRGLYREGDSHLYVSRGCGFWGPPMRVGSPPEIAQLVLTTS